MLVEPAVPFAAGLPKVTEVELYRYERLVESTVGHAVAPQELVMKKIVLLAFAAAVSAGSLPMASAAELPAAGINAHSVKVVHHRHHRRHHHRHPVLRR